jgi:UDP-hydrolysing UDP-N-acetyl-D-glucosamine 2-epimerase
MGRFGMTIGILTSSRADYGIYKPLMQALSADSFFDLSILAFGTHLSKKYGYTIDQIKRDGYQIDAQFETAPSGDSPLDIALSMGRTINSFSHFWAEKSYDIIFALGDRYEMFAAVSSIISFGIRIAHIHGGETTLGAIDNALRHSITSMAHYHFTASEPYKQRVIEIKGNNSNIHNVGALSIDNIKNLTLLSKYDFKAKYRIDLSIPSILITIHPETIHPERNSEYIREFISALKELTKFQLIITMPNADTSGLLIRKHLNTFIEKSPNAIGVESFGSLGYLSCIKHSRMLLGNSSSGFIEAKEFNKPVVNVGARQKGRLITDNIFTASFRKKDILENVIKAIAFKTLESENIYGDGNAASKIKSVLKEIANEDF